MVISKGMAVVGQGQIFFWEGHMMDAHLLVWPLAWYLEDDFAARRYRRSYLHWPSSFWTAVN